MLCALKGNGHFGALVNSLVKSSDKRQMSVAVAGFTDEVLVIVRVNKLSVNEKIVAAHLNRVILGHKEESRGRRSVEGCRYVKVRNLSRVKADNTLAGILNLNDSF